MKKAFLIFIFITLLLYNINSFDDETVKLMGGLDNLSLFLDVSNTLLILGFKINLDDCMKAYVNNINNCKDKNNRITSIENYVNAILISHKIDKVINLIYLNSLTDLKPGDVALLIFSEEPYSAIEFCKDDIWYAYNSLGFEVNPKSNEKIKEIILFKIE